MDGVSDHPFDDIEATLKKSVAAFREANVPALLAGSLAVWARGGPPTEHDVDFVIRPGDAEPALAALRKDGMATEVPPEGWLVKAWSDGVLIDLIFEPLEIEVDDAFFARCDRMSVAAVGMPVMAIDDVLVGKLLALNEHDLEFRSRGTTWGVGG